MVKEAVTRVYTVEDILAQPAQYDHTLEVRSIAPALVLILEKEAPMRMETLASTESELSVLQEECSSNNRWNELLAVYFAARAEEEGIEHTDLWEREDEHARRLEAGTQLSTLRVTD